MKTGRLSSRCHAGQNRDFSPVSWTHYFDEAHDIVVTENLNNNAAVGSNEHGQCDSFRVYLKNFKPPYGPERCANQRDNILQDSDEYSQIPTLVTLHGGGYSGLSWSQFTRHIERECCCRIMAVDLRGHGDTRTQNDDKMDIDTLVRDVISVVHATHRICGFLETPKLILIGHSMGGAIAIKCATKSAEFLPSLAGFVIIDVVEGTAKEALPLMLSVIRTRPTRFASIDGAIEWSVRSGMAKNSDAARVSMPGNLLNIATGHLAIHDIDEQNEEKLVLMRGLIKHKFHISLDSLLTKKSHTLTSLPAGLPLSPRVTSLKCSEGSPQLNVNPKVAPSLSNDHTSLSTDTIIDESDESNVDVASSVEKTQVDTDSYKKPIIDNSGYSWRTDLARTQPHWPGWFDGLSEQLLDAPVQGKFLLLAGIDRLDRTLTIGQMQGKFMMKVLPKCGHAVHEDSPQRVAQEIGQFLVRNKFTKSLLE